MVGMVGMVGIVGMVGMVGICGGRLLGNVLGILLGMLPETSPGTGLEIVGVGKVGGAGTALGTIPISFMSIVSKVLSNRDGFFVCTSSR